MKKIYILLLIAVFGFVAGLQAQIAVNVTGATNTTPNLSATYTSLANAFAGLNAVTAMSGPVTLTMTAGTSETAPVTGLVLGSATLNPVLSATNTITIVKSGGTVTLNAGTGTATSASAAPDGMLVLNGADYVTIDGLTLTDGNSASATVAMEFGIGLFKRAAGDGCNNNTIKNCTINMQRINNTAGTTPLLDGAVGIGVYNSTYTAAATSLTPTNGGTLSTNGTNSNNKFYSNTINGGNTGIGFGGYAAASGVGPTPTATTFLGDLGNDVGGTGASGATTGNTILNFGGGAATNAAVGIRANNEWSLNVSNNTINNNNGSGVNHAAILRGIYGQAGTSANVTISYNAITLKSAGTTTALTGIENVIGATASSNTVSITNNIIQNCTYTTATSATFTGILAGASATNQNINLNTISNNSIGASGTASSCTFQGIYSSVSSTNFTANTNILNSNSLLNSYGTIYMIRGSTSTITVDGNTISSVTIPNSASTTASSIYGYYDGLSPVIENVTNNTMSTFSISGASTATGQIIYGIYNTTTAGAKNFSGNNINTLSFTSSGAGYASVIGIRNPYNTTSTISKNLIYGLSSTGTTPTVAGLYLGSSSATTYNVSNNLIGNLTTPASTGLNLYGIFCGSVGTINLYFNTVYLNSTSTASGSASAAVYMSSTTPVVTLNNNILVNTSTGTTTWNSAALRRTSATLTAYGATSNNNLFYAGTPSTTNLIYYDGTNSDQTLSSFKTRVSTRETASITENPTWQSTTGSNANFLKYSTSVATQIEGGGTSISGYTTDYIGTTRNTSNPDMGAWELNGITPAPVNAGLTVPSSTCTSGTGTLISVTPTTASGTITGVTISYNNGSAAGPISMTNSGGTYSYTIPAASVAGITVTWSITTTNSVPLSTTTTGTSYTYLPAAAVSANATTSATPVCSGSPATLTVSFSSTLAATYAAPPVVSNPTSDEDFANITITQGASTILNNTSANNSLVGTIGTATGTAGSYSNFTSFGPYALAAGQTYNFSVSSSTSGTAYSNALAIYIDYNRNGVFTDAGELVYTSSATTSGAHTEAGSFTVPVGAFNGLTRMRVISNEGLVTSSTMAVSYGEYEEYTLNISGTLNGGGASVSPTAYSWSDGTTVVGTTNPLTINPIASLSYTATSTVQGCPVTSNSVSVAVNPLPATPTNNTSSPQCGQPTYAVTTAVASPVIKWYTASTGGIAVFTGATGVLTYTPATYTGGGATTTLYASVTDANGCESQRVACAVLINDPQTLTISPSGPLNSCTNTVTTFTVTSPLGNFSNYVWSPNTNLFLTGTSTAYNGTSSVTSIDYKRSTVTAPTETITLTATGGGCTATATAVMTVYAVPVVNSVSAAPNNICSGATVSLVGFSGTSAPGSATLGTGSDVSTLSTGGTPYRTGNTVGNQFKNQYLFLASELKAAGLTTGNITSIKLNVAGSGGGTLSNFSVKLGTTAQTAMTATYVTGLTQVLSLATYPATGTLTTGLQTHTFTTPFAWDGNSNVVLEICAQLATSGSAGTLSGDATAFASTIYNNAIPTDCSSTTGSGTSTIRPNVIFGGVVGTNLTPNYTWTWATTLTGPAIANGSTTSHVPVNAGASAVTGTYTATASLNGCSGSLTSSAITLNPAAVVPASQPTSLINASSTSTSITVSFTAASGSPDGYLVIRAASQPTNPVNGTTYVAGTTALGGTIVGVGMPPFTDNSLTPNTSYTYWVYAYNGSSCSYPTYLTSGPLTGSLTTCVNAPVASAATAVGTSGFTANWATVAGATGYVLDVSTSPTFATFVTGFNGLPVGNVLTYSVTGLNSLTVYYYRVRASNGSCQSNNSSSITVTTFTKAPWSENFDGMTTLGAGILPTGWLNITGSYPFTSSTGNAGYNAPFSAPNYVSVYYSTTASSMWTPGFVLTAGVQYSYSFRWVGDAYTGWTGSAAVNTSQSTTGATTLGTFVTSTVTTSATTYTLVTYTYTPSSTGVYYFGTVVSSNSTPYYLGFDNFSLQGPCVAPPSPTSLVQGTTGPGSIGESFTPNATAPDGYLVVTYPTGSAETVPTNAASYSVGQAVGLGVVSNVIAGTASTFTISSLAPNSGYDVYVYPYSNVNCLNGPVFGTALTGINHQTAGCPAIPPVIYVAATGGDYTKLGDVALILNGCPISQPTIVQLRGSYDPSGETYPIVFTKNAGASATNTITIVPQAGISPITISGSNASGPLFDFAGATYYTLDGRLGGIGTSIGLTINNTANNAALRIFNDANNNIVRNVALKSANTAVTNGVVRISTAGGTTLASGNNNNRISNCDIDGGGVSPVGIYAVGSAAPADNKSNIIIDNTIHDFYSDVASTPNFGIHLITNNGVSTGAAWTISGNSFYQTSNRTYANNTTIYTAIGAGFYGTLNSTATIPGVYNITGNYIGGNAPLAAGSSSITATTALAFHGIYLLSAGNASQTLVQNNTVSNVAITTTTGVSSGISAQAGFVSVAGNTIGSTGNANAITYNGTTSGTFLAIWTASATGGTGTSVSVTNNTIAGIGLSSTSVANSFVGIQVGSTTTMTAINTVTGNTIGSSTGPITNSNSSTGSMTGILVANAQGANVNNNTVSYLGLTNASASGAVIGINASAGTVSSTINGNNVNNLTTTSTATATTTSAAIAGIQNTATQSSISNNTVNALTASASAANTIHGIYNAGSAASVNANLVYGLSSSNAVATGSVLNGFYINGGTSVYSNNLLRLGLTNGTIANSIHGIYDITGTNSIYFNSVYIGGGSVATTASNTFAFRSTNTGTRDIRNNVFMNARSNATTGGKHYAVAVAGTAASPTGLTLNNNDYFVSGTGGVFGVYNATDRTTLALWKTAVGLDNASFSANPNFNGPTATVPDLTINAAIASVLESQASLIAGITTDYAGTIRNTNTPDIGAYEFNGVSAVPVIAANSITPSTPQCTATSRTVTVTVNGTVNTVTLNYSYNGVAQTSVTMTNTTGNIWSGVIPAATATPNTTVAYNVVADNGSYTATFNGTNYADEPLANASFNSVTPTDTTTCSGSSVTLNSNTGSNVLRITEVTQNAAGTGGGLTTMPSFLVNDYNLYTTLDMAEITNRGTGSIDISGAKVEYWSSTSLYGSITLPNSISPIASGATVVFVFRTPTGTTPDIPGKLYHGSADLDLGSGTAAGIILKSSTGTILDVVAWNSYAFPVGAGVNATTYPSLSLSTSGIGSIYTNGTTWVQSTTTAGQTSTFGTLNPGVTANLFVPSSIQWFNAANTLLATSTNYTISNPTVTTTYYAKGFNSNGCSITSNNATVTVAPAVTLGSVIQPVVVCSDATSVVIRLTGLIPSTPMAITYNINGGTSQVRNVVSNSTGVAGFSVPVIAANNGQTLSVTSITATLGTLSCSKVFTTGNSTVLTISGSGPSAPTVASGTVFIDLATPYTFTATAPSGATGMRWYDSIGTFLSNTTYTLPSASSCVSNNSRTYYVEANNATCASARTPVSAITKTVISSDPANGLICTTGGSIDLTANVGGTSYAWTGPGLSSSIIKSVTATPSATSIYTVTVPTAACGTITGNFTVGVIPGSPFTPTATPTAVCSDAPIQLASGLTGSNFSVTSTPYSAATAPGTGVTTLVSSGTAAVTLSGGTLDDGGWGNIPIGFTYNFFGANNTSLAISTNGVIGFGTITDYSSTGLGQFSFTATSGVVFPNTANPGNIIAAIASDRDLRYGGTIRYWNDGIAPTRRFIIEYLDVQQYNAGSSTTNTCTVQCILYETTGVVEVHILKSDAGTGNLAPTIGLQNAAKTIGATAPGRTKFTTAISTPEAWRFSPPATYSYAWAPTTNLTNATITNPVFNAGAAAGNYTYTVFVTNPNTGCRTDADVSFVVNPLPTAPSATTSYTYCQNVTAPALTATQNTGNSLLWYTVATGGTGSSTAITPSTTTVGTTNYYVSQSTTEGCEGPRTTISVTVNPAPAVPGVTTPVTLCQNVTASALTATAISGYSLNWYTVSTGGTPVSSITPSTTLAASTPYYVSQVNPGNGCESNRSAINVIVNPAPAAPVVTTPITYCQAMVAGPLSSSATTLSGNTLMWYTQSTGGTGSSTAITPATTTIGTLDYFVSQVTTATTCEGPRSTITVVVNPQPTVVLSASNTSVCSSSAVTYTANPANAGTTPSYKWYVNNVLVAGPTTNPIYSVTNALNNDNVYVVMTATTCSNAVVNSNHIILSNALVSPAITLSASSSNICAGTSVTFSTVVSNGGSSPTYRWFINGSLVSGQTGATFTSSTLNNNDVVTAELTSSLNATCVVSGSNPKVSNGITVTYKTPTSIGSGGQPVSISRCVGSQAQFNVFATGFGTLTYQWRFGGNPITGNASAQTSSLVLNNVSAANAGNYTVTVTGGCGAPVTSNIATLSMSAPTAITTQPISNVACAGTTANLTVVATGQTGLSYQWKKNNVNITGNSSALNSTLVLSNVTASDAASYTVVVTSTCGSVTSSAATLTINPATTITTQPVGVTQCSGGNVSLSVGGSGSGALTYRWKQGNTFLANGGNISGATTANLSITGANPSNSGLYVAEVTAGCGVVNSNGIQVTVNGSTSITSQPLGGSSCTDGSFTFAVSATGFGNITYQWRKGTTAISGATGATYTINPVTASSGGTYNVVVTGGCGTATSNNAVLTVSQNSWTGSFNTTWTDARNWCSSTVPSASSNVLIPVTSRNPVISSNVSINNIDIASSASVTMNNATLSVNGVVTGLGKFIGSGNSGLTFTASQNVGTLYFDPSGIYSLKFTGTGASASLGSSLNIYGELNVGNSILTTNNLLTLKSNVTGTSWLAPVAGSGNVTGNVMVERYIPYHGFRAWRLLSIPTGGTQTINGAWQEGQLAMANGNPGYGVLLTSTSGGNGYDATTAGNSLLTLSGTPGSFSGVSSTNISIATTAGYMVFMRGDRSAALSSTLNSQSPTTLRTNGPLYIGTQDSITIPAGKNVVVGNVYPSAVDFALLVRSGISNFKVWDPKLRGTSNVGGYVTFSSINGYQPTPDGDSTSYGTAPNSRIERGQAFIVSGGTSGGTIQFVEAAKVAIGKNGAFRTPGFIRQLKTNLYAVTANGNQLADGNAVVFDNAYSNDLDDADVLKVNNFGENLGLSAGSSKLAIEARKEVASADTIRYQLSNLKQQQYVFEFLPKNLDASMTAYLEDTYTGARTAISLSGNSTHQFTISSNSASAAADRFRLVFKNTQPITGITLKAYEHNSKVQVDWKVKNEQSIAKYEVEHSTTGTTFTKVAEVAAVANGSAELNYSSLHEAPAKGDNYYRVKSITTRGEATYTDVARVTIGKGSNGFNIYPNPVTDSRVNVEFINQPAGEYVVRLLNKDGRTLFNTTLSHAGGTATQSLRLSSGLAAGTYQLEIVGDKGGRTMQNLVISNK